MRFLDPLREVAEPTTCSSSASPELRTPVFAGTGQPPFGGDMRQCPVPGAAGKNRRPARTSVSYVTHRHLRILCAVGLACLASLSAAAQDRPVTPNRTPAGASCTRTGRSCHRGPICHPVSESGPDTPRVAGPKADTTAPGIPLVGTTTNRRACRPPSPKARLRWLRRRRPDPSGDERRSGRVGHLGRNLRQVSRIPPLAKRCRSNRS